MSSLEFAHRSRLGDVDGAVRVLRGLIGGAPARSISDNEVRIGLDSP